jgi:adenine-specific DNA-methyltransferase
LIVEAPEGNQLRMPFAPETSGNLVPRLARGGRTALFQRRLQDLKASAQGFLSPESSYRFACAVTHCALGVYWNQLQQTQKKSWSLPPLELDEPLPTLAPRVRELAEEIGALLAQSEPIAAGYRIGEIYTALLPAEFRSRHGVFYTPPALTRRMLNLCSAAGLDWATARVLDPACGGGAFLTPVALEMRSALGGKDPLAVVGHIAAHVHGFELDPFGAWMSQVVLESALLDLCHLAGMRLPAVVTVCDALAQHAGEPFDLVIGNPPYGRLTLEPEVRAQYRRSLHGHANIYGLFMDLGVRWARPQGVIAYITPTGFLGGHYFKELRKLMAVEAPPIAIDLVTSRKGVFSDVLQETLLATYRKGGKGRRANVHILALQDETSLDVTSVGAFSLPRTATDPWLIPRHRDQADLVVRLRNMPHRLSDYGYKVSTGPLVWNRHKPQLHVNPVGNSYPILWAECVTPDGRFENRTEKKNHKPYLKPRKDQDWLLTDQPCVLVQRTTAKEQRRRLIAAELPAKLLRKVGAVSVENHLNMVRPVVDQPAVSLRVVAALLNSEVVDAAFRCISGSVAVSATELEALPLPPPEVARRLEEILDAGAAGETLQRYIHDLYTRERAHAAA